MTSAQRRIALLTALAAALALYAGCSSVGSEPKLRLLRVNSPLREPVWVPEKEAVLALSEDGQRVVRVAVGETKPGSRAPVRSREFEDLGDNLTLSPEEPDLAYLPRPDVGRISALDTDGLRVVENHDVGDTPSCVTLGAQSETLFALSGDGASVSGTGLETPERIRLVEVGGSKETTFVESPEKGLDPAFWTAGPGGVAFYGGDPLKRLVGRPMEAADIAVDLTGSQRAYVAEGNRVVALEGDPEDFLGGRLEVMATRDLGERVEHLASDELYVFAATQDRLVAMRRETLETVESVDFGRLLQREGVSPAGVSGVTVGTEDVYLTLEGAPYVLSLKKP
jgi:hypothetical protein